MGAVLSFDSGPESGPKREISTVPHRNRYYAAMQLFLRRMTRLTWRELISGPRTIPDGALDVGAAEPNVAQGAIIELGQLPRGSPIAPPGGESADKGGNHGECPSIWCARGAVFDWSVVHCNKFKMCKKITFSPIPTHPS